MNLSKKILSQSAFVGSMGLVGGFFNYLFTAAAIKTLSLNLLGQWNTYLSWFQIALCLPALIQSFIVLRMPTIQFIKNSFKFHWIFHGILLSFFLIVLYLNEHFSESFFLTLIFILSLSLYCGFNFWLGVCQGQKMFFLFSLIGVSVAFVKFIGTFFVEDIVGFVYLIFISVFIASISIVFLKDFILKNFSILPFDSNEGIQKLKLDLFFSFVVGFFIVLLPNYDILLLRYFVGVESTGEYSRIQLFTKIIFFAPMILLQITLPYYVSEKKSLQSSYLNLKRIRALELLAFALTFLMCLVFGYGGPFFLEYFFGFQGYQPKLIFLACLAILPSYLFMSSIQIFAAFKNIYKILFVLASVFILPIVLILFPVQNVMEYLYLAVMVQFVLAFVVFWMTQREVYR